MNIKVENWNGHVIRFVEIKPGEWQAVGKDVTDALAYANSAETLKYHCRWVAKCYVPHPQNPDKTIAVNVIPEKDIYRLAFRSEQPDAVEFQDWICDMLIQLRQASGLEAFQVFRMLDKEHQKEAMKRLKEGIPGITRREYVKANTITDKTISNRFGLPKMINKEQMTPEILLERQEILDATTDLMRVNEAFGLGLSISKAIYGKFA